MNTNAKILVAEDELTNSILLKKVLSKEGYTVVVANNGLEALKHLEREKFDIVLTDWMMPEIDGIELIRRIRENNVKPAPYIVMITALVSLDAKNYSLDAGADDYIAKPIDVNDLLVRVKDGLNKHRQSSVFKVEQSHKPKNNNSLPPFVGVVIATSTGGPPTILELLKNIPETSPAAFYLVQHGPPWMLETFAQRIGKETKLKVYLVENGMKSQPGCVYLAPGDFHIRINPNDFSLTLDDGPKENFVRPSADPLFRTAAEAFGDYCIALVLTGLGKDGAGGAAQVVMMGGKVLVQDPTTAVAPSMPTAIINSKIKHRVVPIDLMPKALNETIFTNNATLKVAKK